MTNSGSTIISPFTMTTIDRNLRSSSKKELDSAAVMNAGQCDVGSSSLEEDAALARAENEISLSHDEEINSLDSNGNPIVDTEKVENRMLTVALVNSVVESSASVATKGGATEAKEDGEPENQRYSLRKRTRSSTSINGSGEESPRTQSNNIAKTNAAENPRSPRSPGGSRISKRLQTKKVKEEEQQSQSKLPLSQVQTQSQSGSQVQSQSQSQQTSQSQSQTQAQASCAVVVSAQTTPAAPAPAPIALPIKVEPPAPVAPAPVVQAPVRPPVPQVRIQAPPIKTEVRPTQTNPVVVNNPTRVPNPLLGMATSPVEIPQDLGAAPTTNGAAAPLQPQTTVTAVTTSAPASLLPQKTTETETPSLKIEPPSAAATSTTSTAAPLAPAPPVACPLPAHPVAPSMQVTVKVEEATLPVKQEEQVIQRRGRIFSIDIDPAGLDFPDLGIVDAMNQQSELSTAAAPLPPISSTVSGGGSGGRSDHHAHENGTTNNTPTVSNHPTAPDAPPQQEVKPEPPQPAPISNMMPDDMDVNHDLFITGGRDRAMSFEFFSFGINADEPLPPAPDLPTNSDYSVGGRPRGDSIIFDPCSFRDGGVLEEGSLMKSRGNSIDIGGTEEMNIMNTPGFIPAPGSSSHPDKNAHLSSTDHSSALPPPPVSAPATNGSYILPSQTVHPAPRAQPLSSAPPPLGTTTTTTTTNSYGTTTTTTTTTTVTGGKPNGVLGLPGAVNGSAGGVQMATLPSSLSGSSMSHSTFQMELLNKDGRIGIYLPEARKARIAKFHSKRKMRIWRKRIKYDCRKKLADSRPRIKGRFVKRSDMEDDEE